MNKKLILIGLLCLGSLSYANGSTSTTQGTTTLIKAESEYKGETSNKTKWIEIKNDSPKSVSGQVTGQVVPSLDISNINSNPPKTIDVINGYKQGIVIELEGVLKKIEGNSGPLTKEEKNQQTILINNTELLINMIKEVEPQKELPPEKAKKVEELREIQGIVGSFEGFNKLEEAMKEKNQLSEDLKIYLTGLREKIIGSGRDLEKDPTLTRGMKEIGEILEYIAKPTDENFSSKLKDIITMVNEDNFDNIIRDLEAEKQEKDEKIQELTKLNRINEGVQDVFNKLKIQAYQLPVGDLQNSIIQKLREIVGDTEYENSLTPEERIKENARIQLLGNTRTNEGKTGTAVL